MFGAPTPDNATLGALMPRKGESLLGKRKNQQLGELMKQFQMPSHDIFSAAEVSAAYSGERWLPPLKDSLYEEHVKKIKAYKQALKEKGSDANEKVKKATYYNVHMSAHQNWLCMSVLLLDQGEMPLPRPGYNKRETIAPIEWTTYAALTFDKCGLTKIICAANKPITNEKGYCYQAGRLLATAYTRLREEYLFNTKEIVNYNDMTILIERGCIYEQVYFQHFAFGFSDDQLTKTRNKRLQSLTEKINSIITTHSKYYHAHKSQLQAKRDAVNDPEQAMRNLLFLITCYNPTSVWVPDDILALAVSFGTHVNIDIKTGYLELCKKVAACKLVNADRIKNLTGFPEFSSAVKQAETMYAKIDSNTGSKLPKWLKERVGLTDITNQSANPNTNSNTTKREPPRTSSPDLQYQNLSSDAFTRPTIENDGR